MADSMLVIVTKPPYGLEDAFAGLRLALAMSVNGMKVSVVEIEDGVYNAVAGQKPEAVGMPSNVDATTELYDFDVSVYVVKEDLEQRGIEESSLVDGVKTISKDDLRDLLAEHDVTTTF
ncbi:MAG: DsrE family protein [Thermoplasmata archaeon]|nr:DsrE family protein [Thermoplasmata archaeon]